MTGLTKQEVMADFLVYRTLSTVAIAHLTTMTDDPKGVLEVLRLEALLFLAHDTEDFEDADVVRESARTRLNEIFDNIEIG